MPDIVYILEGRDGSSAPLLGSSGLDISSFIETYRLEQFQLAEAQQKDYCFISDDGFAEWMVEKGILTWQVTTVVQVNVNASAVKYVPKHWPSCPECQEGRGDYEQGRILRELNRVDYHRKCTSCGHTWGHHDAPYLRDSPMLEDDGRCTPDGCVPYAISQAGGLPFEAVLRACQDFGWREDGGMESGKALAAATLLGLEMRSVSFPAERGLLTLKKLIHRLDPLRDYIVATNGHWLAVVKGENRDQADTHMRSKVGACWLVMKRNEHATG